MKNQQVILDQLQTLPIPESMPQSCLKVEVNKAGDINITVPMVYQNFFECLLKITAENELMFHVTGYSTPDSFNKLFIQLYTH